MQRWIVFVAAVACLAVPGRARAQNRPWGRISFFADTASLNADGAHRTYDQFVTTATYKSAEVTNNGIEFGFDTRLANYVGLDRDPRVSVYDGWIGARLLDGALAVRGGHMWLTDLGGLGAIAGGYAEYRHPLGGGRLRVAGFGGLEPDTYSASYADGVKRMGGFVAWDGHGLQRDVLGYVLIKNGGMTERSVLTTTNFLPIGGHRALIYQAAEYDLQGPGGSGHGGLTYFFVNGRVQTTKRLEVQATYHHGRSIDTRTITLDQLAGRPVLPKSLEGLLYESAGIRVTAEVARGTRVFAGYAQDTNNRGDPTTTRLTAGGSTMNAFRTGVDVTVSYSQIDRKTGGAYSSWYASAGRSIGARVYLSGDYSTSVSVLRFVGTDGVTIENRPHTDRFSGSATVNLSRTLSALVTAEHTAEVGAYENRVLAGISIRLQ